MRKHVTLALLLPLGLLAGACGSSSKAGSTTTASTAAPTTAAAADTTAAAASTTAAAADPIAEAKAKADAALKAPDKIGPTIPLTGKPPKKTVAWLECELPSCHQISKGFVDATKALGWDLKIISVKSADPGPGFQQAIDAGVDYIALSGTPAAVVQNQIDAAKAKGIGFFSCYSGDKPGGKDNNIYTQCGDNDATTNAGALLADWIIGDSGGKAHTLMVNIPDFPVLVAESKGASAEYAKLCKDCKFDELDVTINDLISGAVPGAVLSRVQKDPSINYIHFSFSDIPAGVADALDGAGLLKNLKLTGVDFNATIGLSEIVKGRHQAWTANAKEYSGWLMVDAMARLSLGMDNPEERANSKLFAYIVADKATAQALIPTDGWPGPAGMDAQFKKLWGLG
jgi:ABC-type sugar transport system substrate-binding protein